jgi:molybdate transport system substrate-binding protein
VPVILVPRGNPKNVKGLEDLLRPDVKAAIGEPDACAVGRVTKVIYQRAGLWQKLQARQPRQAMNVPELAYWVGIGAADAAMVWQAQAHQSEKRCDSIPVSTRLYDPVDISIGLLKFSKHADLAREFMRAIASPESQAIFKDEGYALQPPKPSS